MYVLKRGYYTSPQTSLQIYNILLIRKRKCKIFRRRLHKQFIPSEHCAASTLANFSS